LRAEVLLPHGTPDEVEKYAIAGFLPTQSCKKLRFGVKFP